MCINWSFHFLTRLIGIRQLNISSWVSVQTSRSRWMVTSIVTASRLLTANCSYSVSWNTISRSSKSQENWACAEFGEELTSYHSLASGIYISGRNCSNSFYWPHQWPDLSGSNGTNLLNILDETHLFISFSYFLYFFILREHKTRGKPTSWSLIGLFSFLCAFRTYPPWHLQK